MTPNELHDLLRPTPALAGITRRDKNPSLPLTAHPRARGDHSLIHRYYRQIAGPPPRSRGSRDTPYHRASLKGPTPALAGITGNENADIGEFEAHPRARGDHPPGKKSDIAIAGPPPRSRGSPRTFLKRSFRTRPTPALAGITADKAKAKTWKTAHPRARGDHIQRLRSPLPIPGPPPRSRGSLPHLLLPYEATRPTPALAGITRSRTPGSHGNRGPPPRSRGSRWSWHSNPLLPGPTPALAGITPVRRRTRGANPAHPRARGDHK